MDRIVIKDKASNKTLIEINGEETIITEELLEKRKQILQENEETRKKELEINE